MEQEKKMLDYKKKKSGFLMKWQLICFCVLGLLAGCSQKEAPYVEKPLGELYEKAVASMKRGSYERAADDFDEVERQYPYSDHAGRSQLFSAWCAFKAEKFERAIATLDTFIAMHPSSSSIAYAYYLRSLCYYTDISPVNRDLENAQLALQAFEEVIRRFPTTSYARDVQSRLGLVKEHLAYQEMLVARHYFQEKLFIAALTRLGTLVREYNNSLLIPEALYRITGCQLALGLWTGAEKTVSLLKQKFPAGEWTRMASDLLGQYGSKNLKKS